MTRPALNRQCITVNPSPWTASRSATNGVTPRLRPGEVLLVTVNNDGASIWGLGIQSSRDSTGFDDTAKRAWTHAAWALPYSLPCLWRSSRRFSEPPAAAWLGTVARTGRQASLEALLSGASFGLSFLLALASLVLQRSARSDTVALGEIDPNARITRVGDLSDKIAAILWMAPRIRRLIVADGQAEEARAVVQQLGADIDVIPVSRGGDALDAAFRVSPQQVIVRAGRTDKTRAAMTEELFRLVLAGRADLVDWKPVEKAADLALGEWKQPRLGWRQRWILEFVCGVAARHQRNAGRLPRTDPARLRKLDLPPADRLSVVANYVQHTADTGRPPVAEIERLAKRYLPPLRESLLPHVKVLGSLARVLANCRKPSRALRLQRQLAEILFSQRHFTDTSFQLAEWYRLSGALRQTDEFRAADRAFARVRSEGGYEELPGLYMSLARGKALVCLGRKKQGIAELERVLARAIARGHASIRGSAIRWLTRAEVSFDSSQPAELLPKYAALIELDIAVRDGDKQKARAAIRTLRQIEPGLLGHLLKAAACSRMGAAEYVATFYPY